MFYIIFIAYVNGNHKIYRFDVFHIKFIVYINGNRNENDSNVLFIDLINNTICIKT